MFVSQFISDSVKATFNDMLDDEALRQCIIAPRAEHFGIFRWELMSHFIVACSAGKFKRYKDSKS